MLCRVQCSGPRNVYAVRGQRNKRARMKMTDLVAALAALWDVALPTVEGGTLRLADLRGKQVLLFCWASW